MTTGKTSRRKIPTGIEPGYLWLVKCELSNSNQTGTKEHTTGISRKTSYLQTLGANVTVPGNQTKQKQADAHQALSTNGKRIGTNILTVDLAR